MQRWEATSAEVGARLDGVVARHLGVSVHEARRLITEGFVRVDGKKLDKGQRLLAGAVIEVRAEVRRAGAVLRREELLVPEPELLIELLYEDEVMVAIDKPVGWATHPLRRGEHGTVANALAARIPACATASPDPREAGIVHRLDRETSGVLLAAKTRAAYDALRASFSAGLADKTYWALVHGTPTATVVEAPLVTRGGLARIAPADPAALPARTELRVLISSGTYALVEARAHTGRLHQIRAHLAHLGHPLVGDTRYGAPATADLPADHALLHARAISIPHPGDDWRLSCAAPLPAARRVLFERLLGRALA